VYSVGCLRSGTRVPLVTYYGFGVKERWTVGISTIWRYIQLAESMVLITTVPADVKASFTCVLEYACVRMDVKMHCSLSSVHVPAHVGQNCIRKLILVHNVSLTINDTDDATS
jgi:hypothetical protein